MMKLLVIAVCVVLCSAQETEVDVVVDMDVCSEFCQATRRCPSATSVFTTVRRLTMDCQDCIREECGPAGESNRTEVAECMFMARLTCDDVCQISNSSRTFHANCVRCMEQCEADVANGSAPVIPTRPTKPNRGRPSRPGRTFSFFRGRLINSRTGRVSPFFTSRRITTGSNRPAPRPTPTCRCTSECERRNTRARDCHQCIFDQCRSVSSDNRSQCLTDARMSCTSCTNSTSIGESRRACFACIQRCTGSFRPKATSKPMGRDLCSRNCVYPSYCPSTGAIVNTIRKTSQDCQTCVMQACASMANSSRDMMAECMFEARATCEQCELNESSRNQREKCSMCRKDCEEAEIESAEESESTDMSTDMPDTPDETSSAMPDTMTEEESGDMS